MILLAAAAVSVFGLVLFAFGYAFDSPGVAMVGALFIVGIGAAGAIDGYEYKGGQVETYNNSTNTTTIDYQYQSVSVHTDFPLGVMVTLAGVVLFMGASGRASES